MVPQRDTQSIWIRIGPMAVASILSMSVLVFVSVMILDGVSERLIRQQAEREAIAWAAYIGTSIERIERIERVERIDAEVRAYQAYRAYRADLRLIYI